MQRGRQAYIKGVSTRSVDDLVQAMGMTGISKSQVSRLCEEIDGKVKAFLERPIEGDWPYLWIDATYLKVRRGGRIVSVAVIIAVGVNGDGRHEVLGMEIGTSEAEPIWTEFLRKLTRRGLRGVKLVVSDAHEGIKAAVTKVLCATWQHCRVRFMRNVLAHAGKSGRRVVSAFIATAFAQETPEAASVQWRAVGYKLHVDTGYKLHVDTADGGIPISCIMTSASTHDSQVAVPLGTLTAGRVENLYDLMDAAYDSIEIWAHCILLGHKPIIDVNPRRSVEMQEALRREKKARRTLGLVFPEERRYVVRSGSERINGRLKDEFGGRHVRVRGYDKVLAHLMFGMTVLTASQLMRLIVPPI